MVKIGRYKDKPTISGLSLSEAREEAITLSQKAKVGDLKVQIHVDETSKKYEFITLRQALQEYLENKDLKESTAKDYERCMRASFSRYLDQPIVMVNRGVILKIYRADVKKGKTGCTSQ